MFISLTLIPATSCVSSFQEDTPFGITPTKAGYIPARMALVPCMTWPERSSRIKGQRLGVAGPEETKKLCAELDLYIASGFENQPFMKGLSAKFVEKLYTQAGMSPAVNLAIAQNWQRNPQDCAECTTLAAFYIASIAPRKEWSVWLSEFSRATKGTDAILIPLILHHAIAQENERGLTIARRSAFVAMLLVDTTNGDLIWSGGRESDVVTKAYDEDPEAKKLQPPSQEELNRRLFTDALWLGFPGRQVYK